MRVKHRGIKFGTEFMSAATEIWLCTYGAQPGLYRLYTDCAHIQTKHRLYAQVQQLLHFSIRQVKKWVMFDEINDKTPVTVNASSLMNAKPNKLAQQYLLSLLSKVIGKAHRTPGK